MHKIPVITLMLLQPLELIDCKYISQFAYSIYIYHKHAYDIILKLILSYQFLLRKLELY